MVHCCVLRFGMLMALTFLAACLSVPRVEYLSVLEPKESEWEEYFIGDEGLASYHLEGSRIDVQYMTDSVLNGMFPDDSTGGRLSTNPYTYGDWMDPNLGYVPNRFTVFNVSVYNYTYSKMELDPLKVILLTAREITCNRIRSPLWLIGKAWRGTTGGCGASAGMSTIAFRNE